MKELPADPKPWQPPPERWFDRHEHTSGTSSIKTLTAMRLIVFDRAGLGIPTDKWIVTPVETQLLQQCLKHRPDDLMAVWREHCTSMVSPHHDQNAHLTYMRLLALNAKGQ